MMVVVNMNPMSLKVIGREACLCARGPLSLSKDFGPKKCPKEEESKKMKDFMKVEERSVHCKKYEGHCMTQRIRISKFT
jgi:hypothetical protein